jgi:hypothetical protein
MMRRGFVTGAMALACAGSASAYPEESRYVPEVPPFGRVWVELDGRRVAISFVVVQTPGGTYGSAFHGDVRQYDEYRVPTYSVLGGLTRPTPRERVGMSTAVGRVVLQGSALMVLPNPGAALPARLVILHGDRSWEPPRLQLAGETKLPDPAGLTVIGTARATAQELLLFVGNVVTLDRSA